MVWSALRAYLLGLDPIPFHKAERCNQIHYTSALLRKSHSTMRLRPAPALKPGGSCAVIRERYSRVFERVREVQLDGIFVFDASTRSDRLQ